MNKEHNSKLNTRTAFDLLSDGFKGKTILLHALSLGETRIVLNKVEARTLVKAISNNDYYEIKCIVKRAYKK